MKDITDIEIDKVMAPFADVDEGGAVYFEDKPNWESKKMEHQYDKCQEALVKFIKEVQTAAYSEGFQKGLKMDEEEVTELD